MNLVIEGPRGTGKTSSIEHLVKCMPEKKAFKDMSYYLYYNSPDKTIDTGSYFLGKDIGIGQMLKHVDNIIIDRFLLSSAVYEVLRGKDREIIIRTIRSIIPTLSLDTCIFHLMIHNQESINKFLSLNRDKKDGFFDTVESLQKETDLYLFFYKNLKDRLKIELVEPYILETICAE